MLNKNNKNNLIIKDKISGIKKMILLVLLSLEFIFLCRVFNYLIAIISLIFIFIGAIFFYRKKYYFKIVNFLKEQYLKANKHKSSSLNKFINKIYLRILYILIILFNKPKESFEIFKDDLEKKYGEKIYIIIKDKKISLEKISEKLKNNELKNKNLIIKQLIEKLFKFHTQKQKKIKIASFATLTIIIIATVITSFAITTMFPNVFKSYAASREFAQTDWLGGADGATTGDPAPADWNNFAESTNIDYSTEGEVKLATAEDNFTETFTNNTYKDSENTVANWNTSSGSVEFPTESMGIDLTSKLNFPLETESIYAQVMAGDDIYIGSYYGKFIKYNKTTDEVTDLTSKISSFWGTRNIKLLVFDSANNVIYIGGYDGKFARYNTSAYTLGETSYPDADTAYNLTSKISSFWSSGYYVESLVFDSAHNVLYIGGMGGTFARYNTSAYTLGEESYPDADTAYNLTSKISSFWSTSAIYSLILDSSHNVIYMGGSSGTFARYNTSAYTLGETSYPDADTAYNLTSKISSFWSSSVIDFLTFDSSNNSVYIGGFSSKFVRYNTNSYTLGEALYPNADTGYNLTSKITSFFSGQEVFNSVFDSANKVLYIIGTNARFVRYNTSLYTLGEELYPTADTVYPLSCFVNGFWEGYTIVSEVYGGNNEVYFGGVNGKFAKYNTVTHIATDLTSKIASFWSTTGIYSLVFDSVNNVVYIGGVSGKFARYNTSSYTLGETSYPNADTGYNLTSKISSFWSSSYIIKYLTLDSSHNVIYMGGSSGKFARYNTNAYALGETSYPDADTGYSLTDKISSFWGTSWVNFLAFDSSHNVVYIGGVSGKFARYNTSSYTLGETSYPNADTGYNLIDKIASLWSTTTINSLGFDPVNNVVYIGGDSGKFARYNTASYTLGEVSYPNSDTGYSLTDKISSFWVIPYSIYSIAIDSSSNIIYLGGSNGKFARYSITSSTATDLRSPDTISFWMPAESIQSFCINPSNGDIYIGGFYGSFVKKVAIYSPAYAQSLTFDNLSSNIKYATLTKTDSGSGITYYLSNNGGSDWISVTPGEEAAFTTIGSDLRFKIGVTNGDTVQDVSINYWGYNSTGNLISSAYNTSDLANVLGKIEWTEGTLPEGTDIKFQIRTASTSGGLTSAEWMGPTGAGDYYTAPLGTETINSTSSDGSGDQWFQYKAVLTSTGLYNPTLSDVTLTYVVNAPPQVRNVVALEDSDGTVNITYEALDPDTTAGSVENQGYITPSFQYWNGSSWVSCSTFETGSTDRKSVNMDNITWTEHTAVWLAATDYANHFMNNTAKIRVTVNDGEAANATGYNDSETFSMDTAPPASTYFSINASENPAVLTLSATDDSTFQMKVSTTLHGGTLEAYSTSKTISLETDPDTVYIDFIDAYGNITSLSSITPDKPTNMMAQDVSNLNSSPESYRLFVAWKEVEDPTPIFKRYNVLRSTDDITYASIATISNRAINYYMDTTASFDTIYYYKVTTQDNNDNISYLSASVQGKANGTQDAGEGGGGIGSIPPTISNVASSAITTQTAIITWDTNEPSNSTVEYIKITGGDFTSAPSVGVATMKDTSLGLGEHSVTLSGLTPNTKYYYQVKSQDPDENEATDISETDGYTFTTNQGAAITAGSVATSNIENNSAIIEWTTDINSNSYVVYSTNANLSSSIEIGTATLTKSHVVTISPLTQGTKYYYYVKSTDDEENEAVDKNVADGIITYYTLTTTSDITPPTITNVSAISIADTSTVIIWDTNEGATSKVEYGITSGNYNNATTTSENLDFNHSASITGLTQNTKYYYHVISSDADSNYATSTEESFTTLETLSEESEVVAREAAAENTGETTGKANSSATGGGVLIIDKTDKIPPVISNIEISNITTNSAVASWETNEIAYSAIEFGEELNYKNIAGKIDAAKLSYSVLLEKLNPAINYHYKILSIDSSGNFSESSDEIFSTLAEPLTEEEKLFKNIEDLSDTNVQNISSDETPSQNLESQIFSVDQEKLFLDASVAAKKAMDIIKQTSSQVSIAAAARTFSVQYDSLQELANIIPGPIMSGEPNVIPTATTAIIAWRTDKESNSLVAIAQENSYNRTKDNPYQQVIGDAAGKTLNHIVTIYDLEPNTIYHYQLRSQAEMGPMVKSVDFTLKTKTKNLEITNNTEQVVSGEKAVFKWLTNIETTSEIKYIPYREGKLIVEEAKIASSSGMSIIHEIEINDFETGTVYSVELSGKDIKGQKVSKEINSFSTSENDLPPTIYQIKTDTAISPGKETKVQAIISWFTNEPTKGIVKYMKGIKQDSEDFKESTQLEKNYGKSHVEVITKFTPGSVYSFQIESTDSGGNTNLSKIYTILAPAQSQSVFQIIINNFEKTFGWMGQIGK